MHTSAYVSIRQHTSAYVSIRQHTSAYVRPLASHSAARGAAVSARLRPADTRALKEAEDTCLQREELLLVPIYLRAYGTDALQEAQMYAHVCSRMLTYAHVCSRMLTYADACSSTGTDAVPPPSSKVVVK
jgi:hypothetical protein